MQTIKTAAVVVLMLTVLYGGYVSLTTPPEPLPDEIEEILVIEEAGGSAFGAGEAVASGLQLDEPPPGVLTASTEAMVQPAPLPSPMPSPLPSSTANSAPAPAARANSGTFGSSFADLPPKLESSVDRNSAAAATITKLPAVDPGAPGVTPGPVDSYASTPGDFRLPDPDAAAATFDPTRGAAFNGGPAGFTMTDNSPTTAVETLGNPPAGENRGLINAFKSADAMFVKGQLKEALATLSVFYGMPNLSPDQRQQLLSRLDPLAREVIYSRRHLLEPPHRVTASETLVEIADKYEVPSQLLANINQVDDPVTVLPGTELKIVRGPFRAEVDLTGQQLTLFLGDLYAGRFEIGVGNDPAPKPGTYTVQEKQTSHVYYDRSGVPVPAGSPDNPYGKMWLDLGGQISIHGSPNTVQPTQAGCISVAGDYADDIYGILSQGSSVTIRR
ncbi:L,D-transpeptidase catalytic domain [Stieleria neptunia]|uniref:L,D-transpeptidase catalytic domain n=1 Tax=Stieleria neptunia TaxID=2527979 RepID=A0A518HZS2_9BACT|nr:L,D-transpeptidase family protein [Stieleria neptunia]QDV46346.1 L,D-transpeptidase catalytic domain [Stieleria neptunia]